MFRFPDVARLTNALARAEYLFKQLKSRVNQFLSKKKLVDNREHAFEAQLVLTKKSMLNTDMDWFGKEQLKKSRLAGLVQPQARMIICTESKMYFTICCIHFTTYI